MHVLSRYSEDLKKIEAKGKVDIAEQLVEASRNSDRRPIGIMLDYLKLRRRGKLRLYEYFQYELYDRSKWSEEERERFISAHIHWPLVNQCNDRSWWAVTEDKWLSTVVLKHCGIAIPENVAVFDRGTREYPGIAKLSDARDVETLLKNCDVFPLFAKTMDGMWSAGAFRILGCTETHALLDGHEAVTFEELADGVLGEKSYLIQRCLQPHRFFEGVTDATATVRCLNLIGNDGLSVPFTLLKLPQAGNVADNFWRGGNLVCDVDPESGEIRSIVAKDKGKFQRLDTLPDSDRKFLGEKLPDWEALLEMNAKVAMVHSKNRFGSTDIALTDNGPVIVEVNNGCAFELIQIATGKGFLTDEILAFFESCDAKF